MGSSEFRFEHPAACAENQKKPHSKRVKSRVCETSQTFPDLQDLETFWISRIGRSADLKVPAVMAVRPGSNIPWQTPRDHFCTRENLSEGLLQYWCLPEMGNSARNQHSSRPSFRIPRDHFVPGKRFCSKTNPRKLQGFERHMLSRGGAVAMPRPATAARAAAARAARPR